VIPAAPPSGTDKLYTGQQMDAALGLYNYKARFYSTTLGAFVSADSVGDGLNRYEYVHDNPLRYTDPSGNCAWVGVSCTPQDILRFESCALGGACQTGAYAEASVRTLAIWALAQHAFWHNVWQLVNNLNTDTRVRNPQALNGEILHTLAENFSGSDNFSEEGWRYLSDAAQVSASFFKRSLTELITGDPRQLSLVADANVVGAKPWWTDTAGWGGYKEFAVRIAPYFQYTDATYQDFRLRTLEVYSSGADRAWSIDQFGIIDRYRKRQGLADLPYVPEVDNWSFDMFCWFGDTTDWPC
jgi:RHS repeat-associated protein